MRKKFGELGQELELAEGGKGRRDHGVEPIVRQIPRNDKF